MRRSRRPQAGFSLSEVMIALGLSGLVLAGAFGLIASQRQTYQIQNALAKRQQELWVALEYVQRDMRRAGMGFGACQHTAGTVRFPASVDCYPSGAGSVQELKPVQYVDGGTTGTDELVIIYGQPPGDGTPSATLNSAVVNQWAATSFNLLTASTSSASAFMSPAGVPGGACQCSGSPSCTWPNNVYAILANPDPTTKACSLVEVTAANCAGNSITINARPTLTGYCAAPGGYVPAATTPYGVGETITNLGILQRIRYYISTADPLNPALMRSVNGAAGQVIAYGIEDFQVVPTCDVNGSGLIDPEGGSVGGTAFTTDEWFNNVNGDTIPAGCTVFPLTRVSMIARLPTATVGVSGQVRPALENHAAGTVADNIRRRTLSVIASAPNLGIR